MLTWRQILIQVRASAVPTPYISYYSATSARLSINPYHSRGKIDKLHAGIRWRLSKDDREINGHEVKVYLSREKRRLVWRVSQLD